MQTFNTIPLWKRVVGLIVFGVAIERVVLSVMAYSGEGTGLLVAGYGGEALAALLIAVGLTAQKNRVAIVGAVAGLAAIVAAAYGTRHPAGIGHVLVAVGLFGALSVVFREASQDTSHEPSVDNRTRLLTPFAAQNFAEQKPELFGGIDPSEVSVAPRSDGQWDVRLKDEILETEPLTEPQWQEWLKRHHAHAA